VSPRPLVESIEDIPERKLCPSPVASFIGRKDILDKMRTYFDTENTSQRILCCMALGVQERANLHSNLLKNLTANGTPIRRMKLNRDLLTTVFISFSDIFYVDATNEDTIKADLETIVPGKAKQTVDASLRWLASQTDRNWLLVFDNADNVDLKLKQYFPSCSSGNILITTRNRELRHYTAKDADADVKGMDLDDAKNLLLVQSRVENNGENQALAATIVQVNYFFLFGFFGKFMLTIQELNCFALAVAQAGAFIHCHSSLREYRELYRRERDNLLQNEETQGQDSYQLAVYSTWRLSYEKLDESARTFLQICSCLHHEGISEEIFERAALSQLNLEDSELQDEVAKLLNHLGKQDAGWSSWTFQKVIMRLGSHSLIEHDHQNHTYSIHPLVHLWSGTTMEGNRHDMQKRTLTIIALSFSFTETDKDFEFRRKLLKHTINSIASIKLEEINSLVGMHTARIYHDTGHMKEAEALEVVVVEKRKQVLGDEHPDTLASMQYLATTYWSLGRWSDAEALELVVLEKRKSVLGDDHHDTLIIMGNLAITYLYQGRWKEAEALQVVVMEKSKWLLGEDHPETLRSMGNLADTYRNRGRLDDAEALQLVRLEKSKRLLGDDHPATLITMGNLASTYSEQSRLKDAEALEVLVLEKRKRLSGDEHPDTLRAMSNLAITYWKQGRWNDAEVLQMATMEKTKTVLGEEHPGTLENMANLANTYRDQDRLEDAEVLGADVIEKMKRVLGDGHPDTLKSMSNLAATYRGLGRLDDAEVLEAMVEEHRKRRENF